MAMNTFVEDPVLHNEASPYAEADSGFAGESQEAVASLAEESAVSNVAFAASSVTEFKTIAASTNKRPKVD